MTLRRLAVVASTSSIKFKQSRTQHTLLLITLVSEFQTLTMLANAKALVHANTEAEAANKQASSTGHNFASDGEIIQDQSLQTPNQAQNDNQDDREKITQKYFENLQTHISSFDEQFQEYENLEKSWLDNIFMAVEKIDGENQEAADNISRKLHFFENLYQDARDIAYNSHSPEKNPECSNNQAEIAHHNNEVGTTRKN